MWSILWNIEHLSTLLRVVSFLGKSEFWTACVSPHSSPGGLWWWFWVYCFLWGLLRFPSLLTGAQVAGAAWLTCLLMSTGSSVYPIYRPSIHPPQVTRYAIIERLLQIICSGALLYILYQERSLSNLLVIITNPDLWPSPSRICWCCIYSFIWQHSLSINYKPAAVLGIHNTYCYLVAGLLK